MFGIFARSFRTATRNEYWDAPDHWSQRKPMSGWEKEAEDARARLRAMRSVGMW